VDPYTNFEANRTQSQDGADEIILRDAVGGQSMGRERLSRESINLISQSSRIIVVKRIG
jgi:hypothetical protein